MAPHAEKASHLLKLPPEIRNYIYHLTLVQAEDIPVTSTGYERPAILSTCRTIRKEAFKLYYSGNRFACQPPSYDISPIQKLLEPLKGMKNTTETMR
ncbi:hypothetical protein LTR86_001111 [Recurvomyces mirabilis]|nr:hypothetical protein LTR86_001111 [Recurvomyces mirabilis]